MARLDLLSSPDIVIAIDNLLEEARDVIEATDAETRKREIRDLLISGIELGLAVGVSASRLTPTVIDDIAISGIRMSGLHRVVLNLVMKDD